MNWRGTVMTMRTWSPLAEPKQLFVAGAAIFVADVVARALLWLIWPDEQTDILFGLFVYGVVFLVSTVFAFLWTRRYLLRVVVARLTLVAVPVGLAIGVLAPLASGDAVAQGGVAIAVLRSLLTMAVVAAGATVGLLGAVALGQDPTSRAWHAQAEQVLAKRRKSA